MNKRQVKIGLIGGGFMCKSHTNAYKTMPYIFADQQFVPCLAALCEADQAKAAEMAELYGYEKYYCEWSEMLKADLDFVDVCVPDQVHYQAVMAVLEAGKSLICEKPMALTCADAKKMLEAAVNKGVTHFTGFNYRFVPAVRMAYEMIKDGAIGAPRHIHAKYFQQSGADEKKHYDDIRYVRTEKCGALQGVGAHAIDQMRFLFGEIEAVSSLTATYVKERSLRAGGTAKVAVEDAAAALMNFENGATGVLECSGAFWGRKNSLSWEIYGSLGSLSWELEHPNDLHIYLKNDSDYHDGFTSVNVTGGTHPFMQYWWPGGHNIGWEHAHINMLAGCLENLTSGAKIQPNATFVDGFKAAVIVDTIREASLAGKRIDLAQRYNYASKGE